MPDDDFLAEALAEIQAVPERPELYDPGGHDGPYGYKLTDIDVVPDSLVDFADYLDNDVEAFFDKFVEDKDLLEFTSFGGVVEDGSHLEENYSNAVQSMVELMSDVRMGLAALAGAARYVNYSYLSGDRIAAGELGSAWDDFDVETVGLAFGRQESWPDVSEDSQEELVRQAEEEFGALRESTGTTFTPLDDDGESPRAGAEPADPALAAAQDQTWDQIRTDVDSANRAGEHPFLFPDGPSPPPEYDGHNPYHTELPRHLRDEDDG